VRNREGISGSSGLAREPKCERSLEDGPDSHLRFRAPIFRLISVENSMKKFNSAP
jgi:hypothetical protein